MLAAMQSGVDGYVLKPFAHELLRQRIQSLTRKSALPSEDRTPMSKAA